METVSWVRGPVVPRAVGKGAIWAIDAFYVGIDPQTGGVVAKIPIEIGVTDPPSGEITVTDEAIWLADYKGRLYRIDPRTNEVVAAIAMPEVEMFEAAFGE
jgi:hypothetical protein